MRLDTPPSSVNGDDEIVGLSDEEMIYYGDVDEYIEHLENENDEELVEVESENEDEDESNFYDLPDNSKLVFEKHNGSVFCGSLHPNGIFAVSGGEDDKAFVWDVNTGDVLLECGDHSDSVVIASFSFDGVYLATVDMRGNIFVRKCPTDENKTWDVVWSYQAGDISWGFWHPAAHVLVCCENGGDIYVWKIPSGETKFLQGHGSHSSCGVFLRDGKRLAVGYADSSVKIWDLKTSTSLFHIHISSVGSDGSTHESGEVLCIDSFHDNNLIIAGTEHGNVMTIKSNTGQIIGNLSLEVAIESIKFCTNPNLGLVAIGALGGALSVWDVGRQTRRYVYQYENGGGITSVSWIDDDVVITYFSGHTKILNGKSGESLYTLRGHRSEVLDISYHAPRKIIMTSSDDGTCRTFDLNSIEN